jgi:hypothetical protein
MHPVVPGAQLSTQILAFAKARGRLDTAGKPDLSGLAITQGACTYVIAQSSPLVWTTEWIRSKGRTWKPFRTGSTLELGHIGRRAWETRKVQRPRTVVEVECYVFGGITHRRFEDSRQAALGRGDRDAFADFLATVDAGVYQLGSIDGVCVDPADHFGWIDT